MEKQRFWSRVGHWFKPGTTGGAPEGQPGQTGGDGFVNPATDPIVHDGSRGLLHLRRSGQGQALHRLQDGYVKLTGLVDSIHNHLQTQDDRTRQMADALSQLAQTVGQLPEAAQAQHKQLAVVAEQLESSNARLARWESTISQIPSLGEAQRETLQALGEQIGLTRQTHEHIARSMDGFGEAFNSLGQAFGASVETLKDLQVSAASREDSLTTLLAEHNRRFTRLFVGAIVLAAVVGVSTVVMLILK